MDSKKKPEPQPVSHFEMPKEAEEITHKSLFSNIKIDFSKTGVQSTFHKNPVKNYGFGISDSFG